MQSEKIASLMNHTVNMLLFINTPINQDLLSVVLHKSAHVGKKKSHEMKHTCNSTTILKYCLQYFHKSIKM